jgi:hypothetical protein
VDSLEHIGDDEIEDLKRGKSKKIAIWHKLSEAIQTVEKRCGRSLAKINPIGDGEAGAAGPHLK